MLSPDLNKKSHRNNHLYIVQLFLWIVFILMEITQHCTIRKLCVPRCLMLFHELQRLLLPHLKILRRTQDDTECHFANSTARVSRITLTLMVPGYFRVASILVATSRASLIAVRSSIFSGFTNTRISRPALMA